jgi:Ca-activated chloride channel family protein
MLPAVTAQRTKTTTLFTLLGAVIAIAIWLAPRGPRAVTVVPHVTPGGPCDLAVTSRLTSTHVLVGEGEEHLAITVRAPEGCTTTMTRPPLSVAIVIDRSGSMQGQPIIDARRAARRMVDLLEPTDAFSIVTFSDSAEVIAPMARATDDAKNRARAAIDGIADDGGTNITAGLEIGNQQLLATPVRDGVRRVVLMSDGKPDGIEAGGQIAGRIRARLAGLASEIAAHGASISSVGLGIDYDEVTMTDIAVAGRGNYYYLEDSRQLADLFATELGSLGKTVAADAQVTVTPTDAMTVLEVYGYGARREGNSWIVPIADLMAGETRKIVMRVRVRAEAKGTIDLATSHVVYRPVDAHQQRVVTVVAKADVTSDTLAVRNGVDTATAKVIVEAQTARTLEQATIIAEQEGYAAAQKILADGRARAQAQAEAYGDAGIAAGATETADKVMADFAKAPAPSSPESKKARKSAAKAAYDLAK